jgi:hypothetical protein
MGCCREDAGAGELLLFTYLISIGGKQVTVFITFAFSFLKFP